MRKVNLSEVRNAYFIGIKGAGMAAVAVFFVKKGIKVSGSDTAEKFFTDELLQKNNIVWQESFAVQNIPAEADLIVYSTAYSEKNNIEVAEAKKRPVLFLSYPEVLGALLEGKIGIAVCGTHGKTTTTALLSQAVSAAGGDPEAIVGSQVAEWGSGVLAGAGKYCIIEADEYQNKLQYYNPFAVMLTSMDWDHPDYFPSFEIYKDVFKAFVSRIPPHGFLVVWGDSVDTLEVAASAKKYFTYGFLENNDYMISQYSLEMTDLPRQKFQVFFRGNNLGEFSISLVGKHNVLNAVAVIAMCHRLGLDLIAVKRALFSFRGTSRRFEYVGQKNGAILIDDYAHHPEEIKTTLKGAREIYPSKNIITVFHPHTFTRTKMLLQDFAQSFGDVDKVIILDIYGSAREKQGGVSSGELAALVNTYNRDKAEYVPTIQEVVELLRDKIGPDDVVISMGAGNVWEVVDKLRDE